MLNKKFKTYVVLTLFVLFASLANFACKTNDTSGITNIPTSPSENTAVTSAGFNVSNYQTKTLSASTGLSSIPSGTIVHGVIKGQVTDTGMSAKATVMLEGQLLVDSSGNPLLASLSGTPFTNNTGLKGSFTGAYTGYVKNGELLIGTSINKIPGQSSVSVYWENKTPQWTGTPNPPVQAFQTTYSSAIGNANFNLSIHPQIEGGKVIDGTYIVVSNGTTYEGTFYSYDGTIGKLSGPVLEGDFQGKIWGSYKYQITPTNNTYGIQTYGTFKGSGKILLEGRLTWDTLNDVGRSRILAYGDETLNADDNNGTGNSEETKKFITVAVVKNVDPEHPERNYLEMIILDCSTGQRVRLNETQGTNVQATIDGQPLYYFSQYGLFLNYGNTISVKNPGETSTLKVTGTITLLNGMKHTFNINKTIVVPGKADVSTIKINGSTDGMWNNKSMNSVAVGDAGSGTNFARFQIYRMDDTRILGSGTQPKENPFTFADSSTWGIDNDEYVIVRVAGENTQGLEGYMNPGIGSHDHNGFYSSMDENYKYNGGSIFIVNSSFVEKKVKIGVKEELIEIEIDRDHGNPGNCNVKSIPARVKNALKNLLDNRKSGVIFWKSFYKWQPKRKGLLVKYLPPYAEYRSHYRCIKVKFGGNENPEISFGWYKKESREVIPEISQGYSFVFAKDTEYVKVYGINNRRKIYWHAAQFFWACAVVFK